MPPPPWLAPCTLAIAAGDPYAATTMADFRVRADVLRACRIAVGAHVMARGYPAVTIRGERVAGAAGWTDWIFRNGAEALAEGAMEAG